jgi:hypothetical protein
MAGKRGKASGYSSGNVVLIESEGKGRTFWPTARVMEAYPGRDGYVRVLRLKTAVGEMVRHVQRMYPLEVKTQVEVPDVSKQQTQDDVSSTSPKLEKN